MIWSGRISPVFARQPYADLSTQLGLGLRDLGNSLTLVLELGKRKGAETTCDYSEFQRASAWQSRSQLVAIRPWNKGCLAQVQARQGPSSQVATQQPAQSLAASPMLPTARPTRTAVSKLSRVFERSSPHLAVGTYRADGLFCFGATVAPSRTGRTPNV